MQEKEINALIGQAVRRYRNKAKLTQRQVAELSGMSTNNVARIERGEIGVSIKSLFDLAESLSVSPALLVKE